MNLNRMRIATKLWLFISLVLGLLVGIASVGLLRSASILAEGRAQQEVAIKLVQVVTRWSGLTETNAARNLAMMVSTDAAVTTLFNDVTESTSKDIGQLQKELEALPLRDSDRAQLAKIGELRTKVIDTRTRARKLREGGNADEALKVLNSEYLPVMTSYQASQRELVKMQEQRQIDVQNETEARRQANSVGILIGLAVVVTLLLPSHH